MSETCTSNDCASCSANCGQRQAPQDLRAPANPLSHVKKVIAVVSGKGGVGKSTVTASLAVAMARKGRKVAILDADITGPSIPTAFGIHEKATGTDEGIDPAVTAGGIKLMSLNLLTANETDPVIWRGPAKIGVLKQLLEEVVWGELDYLVLDFPPGTGDEVLSACQMITGDKQAVIVTTPQELSMADCRKCLDFCAKVDVRVGGIVENMSGFTCPDCGHTHPLFSSGGGERLAKAYSIPLIAQLPLDPKFMEQCDAGAVAEALEKAPAIGSALSVAAEILSR